MHPFLNQQPQGMQMGNNPLNQNPPNFSLNNPSEYGDNNQAHLMKVLLLKNQAMNNNNNNNNRKALSNSSNNQQNNANQPPNQMPTNNPNFPSNLLLNLNEKKKIGNANMGQNNYQNQHFNPASLNQQNTPNPQNSNPHNIFNFNNNFSQNLLKNMMNNNKSIPLNNNSNENKIKPDPMNFNMKKPLSQLNASNINFMNRETFSSSQLENLGGLPSNDDDFSKIKEKSKFDRTQKIEKYKNKKRNWKKKISYDCRKKVADARMRIKGRFISKKVKVSLFSKYLH